MNHARDPKVRRSDFRKPFSYGPAQSSQKKPGFFQRGTKPEGPNQNGVSGITTSPLAGCSQCRKILYLAVLGQKSPPPGPSPTENISRGAKL